MNQTKLKDLLWTVALLLALSFLAAMVLPRREEPKIKGKISSRDISEISKVILDVEQEGIEDEMKACVKGGKLKLLLKKFEEYNSIKIASVEAWPGNAVLATLAPRTNRIDKVFYLVKDQTGWKCASPPWNLSAHVAEPTTNTAPVSTDGVPVSTH